MASYNMFNYNYRPSKSIERKILVELLKEIYGISGISECTYIGLGSIFFADFKLLHKELGITRMVNIEAEASDEERFKFNSPFSCIKLKWGRTTDVLSNTDWSDKKIIWLDYDKSLQNYMFDDIDVIFSNVQAGSFYMMSCNSSFQRFYDKKENFYKLEEFKTHFDGLYPHDLKTEMLANKNSPILIREMVNNRIKHNLKFLNSARPKDNQLEFLQLLFIVYQDGAPMVSVGGIILEKKDVSIFKKSNTFKLPYIRTGDQYLNIETPLITNREIGLLNSFLPSTKYRFLNRKSIGFVPKEEREKYLNTYRYYPNFVEIRDF